MRPILFTVIASQLIFSCNQNGESPNDLLLEENSQIEENTPINQHPSTTSQPEEVSYETHSPCTFSVTLPSSFKLEPMYDDFSSDYCHYSVKTKDGFEIIELHSLLSSRFEFDTAKDLYDAALLGSKLEISYKTQKGNWFVISGTNNENGNIVYWKRVVGEQFTSDLHIEYPKNREAEINPHIGTISKSFTSE